MPFYLSGIGDMSILRSYYDLKRVLYRIANLTYAYFQIGFVNEIVQCYWCSEIYTYRIAFELYRTYLLDGTLAFILFDCILTVFILREI